MLTCPVTVWLVSPTGSQIKRGQSRPCRQPLAEGAPFCAKHEADRIRLGGDP